MKVRAEIDTEEWARLRLKLMGLDRDIFNAVYDEVVTGASDIRNTIIRSMYETPKTGRVYRRQKAKGRKKKYHVASSPGNPPAVDSGELVSRITMDARPFEIEVGAESGAPYSVWLEKGTAKMKARPFLEPAKDKHLPEIEGNIKRAIMRTLER